MQTPPRAAMPPRGPVDSMQGGRLGQTSHLSKQRSRTGIALPLQHVPAPAFAPASHRPDAHRTHRPTDLLLQQSYRLPASGAGHPGFAAGGSTPPLGARPQQRPPLVPPAGLTAAPSDYGAPLSTRRDVNPPSTRRSLASCASQWAYSGPPPSQRSMMRGSGAGGAQTWADIYSA